MAHATLEKAMQRVAEAQLAGDQLSIAWHAGEPMVISRDWYAESFARIRRIMPDDMVLEHNFQTNATLIDQAWCGFIKRHQIRVGVSIDGPEFIHNLSRRTRLGGGTHARVMGGVRCLQDANIPVHAICVLTRASLEHPDEIYDFFTNEGIQEFGFNVEECDGVNTSTSLDDDDATQAFARFFARIVDRYRKDPCRPRIREITRVADALLDPAYGEYDDNAENAPMAIVSIAWDGSLSTFSPELLGTTHPSYGSFCFGNVSNCSFGDIAETSTFRWILEEISTGVADCRKSCAYFNFCRGGSPANKLAEHGRFDCTSSQFCKMTQMIVVETVLAALDIDLVNAETSEAALL